MRKNTVMSKEKTAVYLRSAHFDDDAITNQRNAIERYAELNGIRELRYYTDKGVNGVGLDRPALIQLVADVKSRKVDVIIIHSLCRLARGYALMNNIFRVLEEYGVRLVSVRDG